MLPNSLYKQNVTNSNVDSFVRNCKLKGGFILTKSSQFGEMLKVVSAKLLGQIFVQCFVIEDNEFLFSSTTLHKYLSKQLSKAFIQLKILFYIITKVLEIELSKKNNCNLTQYHVHIVAVKVTKRMQERLITQLGLIAKGLG